MNEYLESTDVINWQDEFIRALAEELAERSASRTEIAKRTFDWVRDHIQHSTDFERNEVTCRASQVLTARTGICYAKSHLLAALMRANGIPTGFCYQRLSLDDSGTSFCLHGLNAVHLEPFGWFRIDARGNTDSIQTEFDPPHESLAFATTVPGEANLPEVWPAPLPIVIAALQQAADVDDLASNLPDVPILNLQT